MHFLNITISHVGIWDYPFWGIERISKKYFDVLKMPSKLKKVVECPKKEGSNIFSDFFLVGFFVGLDEGSPRLHIVHSW